MNARWVFRKSLFSFVFAVCYQVASMAVSAQVANAAQVRYTVISSWTAGFEAELVVTNRMSQPVKNWQLAFDFAASITRIWNGAIIAHTGQHYILAAPRAAWASKDLMPGQSVKLGFVASGKSGNLPKAGALNGMRIAFNETTAIKEPAIMPKPRPHRFKLGANEFAPYVDMTLPLDLESVATTQGISGLRLAFIVAESPGQASPSWGGSYSVTAQYRVNDVRRLQERGKGVTISFGGANGTDLAVAAPSADALQAAYRSVIDTYHVQSCDFDIEGAALGDEPSIHRRSQALSKLQRELDSQKKPLEIWYTLPVTPNGLTADGLKVLESAVDQGVKLRGINIMAMNYGGSAAPKSSGRMGYLATEAAEHLFLQLQATYYQHGKPKAPEELWNMVGITPMIGVNDVKSEIFLPSDAHHLLSFAQKKKVGLLSFWSLHRDRPCDNETSSVSPFCSGIPQTALEFTGILRAFSNSARMRSSSLRTSVKP